MEIYQATVFAKFEQMTRGHRYMACCSLAPTTDEVRVLAVDFDGGRGHVTIDVPMVQVGDLNASLDERVAPMIEAFYRGVKVLDERHAHADTIPQPLFTQPQIKPYLETASKIYGPYSCCPSMPRDPVVAMYTALFDKLDPLILSGARRAAVTPADPLDVKHDGVTLRDLLTWDQRSRQEDGQRDRTFGGAPTPAQRAAISAHWSAELRAKVAAAKVKEREQVVVDRQDEP